MRLRHLSLRFFATVTFLLIIANAALPQTQPETKRLRQERISLARAYLLAATVNAPLNLDPDHAKELKDALVTWFEQRDRKSEPPIEGVSFRYTAARPGLFAMPEANAPGSPALFSWVTPSVPERIVRITEVKVEGQEQPKTVLIGQQQTPTLNPDHVLWKYSTNFDFSQLFVSSNDVSSVYTSIKKFADGSDIKVDMSSGPCGNPTAAGFMNCLRRSDHMGILNRAISGVKASLSISQNPKVVSGVVIQPGSPAAGTKQLYSGEVDFDPSNLFPSGSDWKSGFDAADAAGAPKSRVSVSACAKNPQGYDCFHELAGPSKATAVLAGFIPKVSYQVKTQFDFIKSNGDFIRSPFPEDHLWYVSFTMDIRKALASTKARTDALVPFKQFNTDAPKSTALDSAGRCTLELPAASVGQFYQYEFDDGQGDRKWSFDEGQCVKTPAPAGNYRAASCVWNGLELKKNGVLSGFPQKTDSGILYLTISGANTSLKTCARISIRGGARESVQQALLLDYLEMSVDPDIVLNDSWFAQFREHARQALPPEDGKVNLASAR